MQYHKRQYIDYSPQPAPRRSRFGLKPGPRRHRATGAALLASPFIALLFALAAAALGTLSRGAEAAGGIPRQNVEAVREAIREFAREHDFGTAEQARVVVGHIDPRLRLRQCETPLQVAFNSQQQRNSARAFVAVRCAAPAPWTIYVPIDLQLFGEVAISRRPLPRGAVLSAADLQLARRNLANLPGGYFTDPSELVGMQLRRPLAGNSVLSPNSVVPPKVVRRGERVALILDTGAVSVRMRGTALADAARGERVAARNASSGRVVEGTASAPGVIKLNPR